MKILEKNGILIIHRHKKDNIDITSELKILDTRIYGISKIIIGS
jgi:16S rRNA (guanine966-N2)-methyltransferase